MGGQSRILLVEDDRGIRQFLSDALSGSYHIETAENGRDAIGKLEAGGSYDVIISDLAMPEVDGLAFVEYIRSKGIQTPVVVVSGNVFGDERKRLKSLGIDLILEKPITPISKLFAAIEMSLGEARRRARRKLVLIADDDKKLRKVLRKFLEKNGFGVLEAANGPDALAAAKREKPDLILMDSLMPGLSGKDCCAALKKDPETNSIIIIMCTAKITETYLNECREAGADDFIAKPVKMDMLLEKVKSIEMN